MAAGPEDVADDPEPFSPSDFLDLPPTPRPDGDGGPVPRDDDDLVLPFITRVLMEEEDIDDNDPDYPALLEAQQPFADILSDAAASSATKHSGFDSAAANTDGSVPVPLFPDAPAFANATWPHDPVELSQMLLLSRTTHPDIGAISKQHGSSEFMPAGGGEDDDSLASTLFGGRNRVTMDMLNQAFLKGMEEANKFLPTTNSSLLMATSGEYLLPRDSKQPHVFFAGRQAKTTGMVDGVSIFQEIAANGRGRKNRHTNWDNLEAETGRSCKLMAPETEEASEVVDEFILNGYQSLVQSMRDMSISTDREAKKNTRKGRGSTNTDEAVDLRTLLIHCAQAMATGDSLHATELLREIKRRSSPRGDATQRLAHCFGQGLEARLAGTGSQVYKSLMARRPSAVEFHKAYRLYLTVCCFQMIAFKFSNMIIWKAITGRKKVHIVDYGGHYGFQWPTLLGFFGTWKGGPPEVKITAIDLPQPGFRPAARVEQTGRQLSNFARQCGVPFKFNSIVAKWETVYADDLSIEPDEVLIVNGLFHFGKLMDEGGDIDSPSPRDMVLRNIQKMRPDVFILCTENSSYNAPFFVTRFREALFYYSAMFDMMDATAPRDNAERVLVEQDIFGRCALNAIACEGLDRVERPEVYKKWQVRNDRAGLRELPLNLDIVKAVSKKVKDGYHKDFVIDVDQQWLLQGWKGRILYAMSTWVAKDATS
ncbi:Scarecrow-like protein 9 [Dichanthelium oligosanthes]|uniref:Scarecrow-like protein 9 n=1 Tax=Dichanthelium oligosanthes TaxID=888268 RepID=A0A1E5WF13_9POAL|nr:Scarecrow-like protein 9 [Dichanthelium oligosanthes]